MRLARLALAAVAVLAVAPAAQADPLLPEAVPPVCVRQPLPAPVPFSQIQVGYCPA